MTVFSLIARRFVRRSLYNGVIAATLVGVMGVPQVAEAQDREAPDGEPVEETEIVVVGSQIRGHNIAGALPVTIVGQEQIAGVAAVSGGDLYRSIPTMGAVTFNEQVAGNQNSARGDVSTISLRGLGQGNTLVLINGRRTVLHPTTQVITGVTDSAVPAFGYNANAIPIGATDRVEVLLDGASALYGSDAVAGVVNNVLKSDFTGARFDVQYGGAEGTNLREFAVNGLVGFNFGGGRGNISLFGGYARKSKLYQHDQDYTASSDRRSFVAGTSFENVSAFNSGSSSGPWGRFQVAGSGAITSNGITITNASRQFHLQPATNPGCLAATATPGVCIDDGTGSTEIAGADSNMRFDSSATFSDLTTQPSASRINLFSFANYELSDNLSFFGEAGFYRGRTEAIGTPIGPAGTAPITVAADAYWNPFGPIDSPNRLPDLNIPDEGLPVTISSYTYVDVGTRRINVTNHQYRFLAGLRGEVSNWNWETASLYTWATVRDAEDRLSSTLLQQAVNRTTSDAYNPFNGGSLDVPSIGDGTPSSQSAIDSFLIKSIRRNKTTLALWDFKLSNADLFSLWGGNSVGVAAGVEYRRETFEDDRDPRQDGQITYTNSVTGTFIGSDLAGASPSADVSGKRNVWSAYAELALPLISPEMHIPLVRAFDLQIAGRYERYSDVGDVAKPKVAARWELLQGVSLRGSWSQGFRAPSLEVLNTQQLERSSSGTEYVLCEADLRSGRIENFSACSRNRSVVQRTGGNPDLKPEESTSWSFGTVLQPNLPSGLGEVVVTVDHWQIRQKGIVGQLSFQDALNLDYALRVKGGSNPAVVRREPTAEDIDLVAGTGLAPIGELLYVTGPFDNLLPITVEGIDIGLTYRLRDTGIGNFALALNAAHLLKFQLDPSAAVQAIIEAREDGTINAAVPVQGGGDMIGRDGQPRWRLSANLTWNAGPITIGAFTQFIDDVYQNNVSDPDNNKWIVEGQTAVNLHATYRFDQGVLSDTSITVGARNIFDKNPPFASNGYLASLYQPQARYWYTKISKSF